MPPEIQPEKGVQLREREGQLVRMIGALKTVETSEEWSTLKTELFDGALESLEGRLSAEAKKLQVDLPTIYRLQGEIRWAKKYADLASLAESYLLELQRIKQLT